ncbi:hypothetical protein HaLaN_12593 [Haematococcus lacustris]|uniref:Uncharacterized protein n=1 Tax=Haematococcus lacustris TaxID=44745 RepID=A0A699Z103_HAELA|nr:hypothetical protein HaLaN_12593 [Haematococcus lacustris]
MFDWNCHRSLSMRAATCDPGCVPIRDRGYPHWCTRSRLSLAYHSAAWPPPTHPNPPPPNLVYPAQLPVAPPPSLPSASCP